MDKKKEFISLEEWYDDYALEVVLPDEEKFLQVAETLTRIGLMAHKEKKLFQTAHILHKQGKYYIVHFKELFILDGRAVDITPEDIKRRNTIATLLEDWDLVTIVNPDKFTDQLPIGAIKIIKYSEKDEYDLVPKYQIGGKK